MQMKPKYLSLKPLVQWATESRPIEWHRLFGRSAELEVEIGFGLGDFLVRRALERPEMNLVGIELSWVPVRRALRKIALAGVENARILRADARVAMERLFLEESLSRIWAIFPCPWPKKRHRKHRLFANGFLRLLNSRLMREGELLIVTDDRSYFEWIQAQMTGAGFQVHPEIISPRFFTKYERKWRESGQRLFFELRLIKKHHIKPRIKEETALITHRVDHFDHEAFRPTNGKGDILVDFKEFLYDPRKRKGMVRSVVSEDSLLQDFWMEIVQLEDGWHIRPAKGCGMLPTAGVQRALDLVHEAIEE